MSVEGPDEVGDVMTKGSPSHLDPGCVNQEDKVHNKEVFAVHKEKIELEETPDLSATEQLPTQGPDDVGDVRTKGSPSHLGPGGDVSNNRTDLNLLLSDKYYSRPEDLARLNAEHQKLLKIVQSYNVAWSKEKDDIDPDEDRDVMVFGDVIVTEDEMNLLRLGPDFMVTSCLDEKEMQVEASVCMTKIRWSKRSKGTDELTEKQSSKEFEPPTLEEEKLAEAMGGRDA